MAVRQPFYPLRRRRPVRRAGFRFGFVRCDGGDSLFDGYGRTDRFGRFGQPGVSGGRRDAEGAAAADSRHARGSARHDPFAQPLAADRGRRDRLSGVAVVLFEAGETIVERVLSLLGVDAPHYEWGAER